MALTFEQFKQLRSQGLSTEQIANFESGKKPKSYIEPEKTFGQQIKEDVASRRAKTEEALRATSQGEQSKIEGATQTVGQAFGLIGDVAGRTVSAITPGFIKKPLEKVGGAVLTSTPAQKAISSYQQFAAENPRAARNIGSAANFASGASTLATAGMGVQGLAKAIPKVSTSVKQGISNIKSSSKANIVDRAISDATPDYNILSESQKIKLQSQTVGNIPRVIEGKGFTKRSVTPNKIEIASGNEVSKIQGYKPNLTYLEKENLITRDISQKSDLLRASIRAEKQIVPKREVIAKVREAVNSASEESLTLQARDPILSKYMQSIKTALSEQPGNLEGVLDTRQLMDRAYKTARGKLAFGSESFSALDEIHDAARSALNDFLISNARNTAVKETLLSESLLYKALSNISVKAAKEAPSVLGRALKKAPLLKKAGLVAGGAALGALGIKSVSDNNTN